MNAAHAIPATLVAANATT